MANHRGERHKSSENQRILIGSILLLGLLFCSTTGFIFLSDDSKRIEAATYVQAVCSAPAFGGVVIAIILQGRELKFQGDQLKQTTHELASTAFLNATIAYCANVQNNPSLLKEGDYTIEGVHELLSSVLHNMRGQLTELLDPTKRLTLACERVLIALIIITPYHERTDDAIRKWRDELVVILKNVKDPDVRIVLDFDSLEELCLTVSELADYIGDDKSERVEAALAEFNAWKTSAKQLTPERIKELEW